MAIADRCRPTHWFPTCPCGSKQGWPCIQHVPIYRKLVASRVGNNAAPFPPSVPASPRCWHQEVGCQKRHRSATGAKLPRPQCLVAGNQSECGGPLAQSNQRKTMTDLLGKIPSCDSKGPSDSDTEPSCNMLAVYDDVAGKLMLLNVIECYWGNEHP